MKKALAIAVVICLSFWAACVRADFDPSKVINIAVQLVPEPDGVEGSPFPFRLGETTIPSVLVTLVGQSTPVPPPPQYLTVTSLNSNVVSVGPNFQLTANALGSTTINFKVGALTLGKTVKVAAPVAQLLHRYSFDTNADPLAVLDSVGGANGVLTNDTPGGTLPIFTNGQAQFDGSNGYIRLPAGLASQFTNLSLVTWLTADGNTNFRVPPRLLDFAQVDTNNPPGRTGGVALDIDNTTLHAQWGGLTNEYKFNWEGSQLGNARTGVVAVVVSPSTLLFGPAGSTAQTPKGITNFPPLPTLMDTDNRIGSAVGTNLFFRGSLAEFRMYEGLLSDYDVALIRTNGADAVPALLGELRRIHLVFNSTPLQISNAQPTTISAIAEFTGASNVDLVASGFAAILTNAGSTSWISSNQFNVIGPGPANIQVKSLLTSSILATIPLPIAPPLQIRLQLPTTNFNSRGSSVPYSARGDYLYASNVDLTGNSQTHVSLSDNSVFQLLSGAKIVPQTTGTDILTAQYLGLTASAFLTVTNPAGFAATFPRLTYRWKFNDPTGSYYAHDALSNAVLFATPLYQLVNNHPQQVGTYPQFDGVSTAQLNSFFGGYFGMAYGIFQPLTNCTVEFWVECNSVHYFYHFFDLFQPTNPYSSDPYYGQANPLDGFMYLAPASPDGTGGVEAVYQPGGTDTNAFYKLYGPGMASGTWTHVVWVHSPALGVAELYVNGVQVAATNTSVPFPTTDSQTVGWLGRNGTQPDACFPGAYDEFRIYDGALSPIQVQANYNAGPQSYSLPLAALTATGFNLQPETDGQHVKVKIPNPRSGIILESSPILGSNALWTPVTAAPQTEPDETTSVELPLTTSAYFRLRLP